MKRLTIIALVVSAITTIIAGPVGAADSLSLDDLLKKVKGGRIQDSRENAARIDAFKANKGRQLQLLADAKAERTREESRSEALETAFEENDLKIVDLEAALKERLGSLKELFGVLQQASGDARGQFENSLTQVVGCEL
tara:strand:+ start:656 stop:1072 length:417 start_codon:yes stop_codon:yes gene_type:complete